MGGDMGGMGDDLSGSMPNPALEPQGDEFGMADAASGEEELPTGRELK
jgi:hypothetical protein